jgi:hypothetical protein
MGAESITEFSSEGFEEEVFEDVDLIIGATVVENQHLFRGPHVLLGVIVYCLE